MLAALLWLGLAVAAWHVPRGIPAIWELRSRRDSRWPIGVQEENDERPWYRRHGTPEWQQPMPRTSPLRLSSAALVDLHDAGRHAPTWATETHLPRLERVRKD